LSVFFAKIIFQAFPEWGSPRAKDGATALGKMTFI
jgi:hypothetical protein